jgi:hypothetical protein
MLTGKKPMGFVPRSCSWIIRASVALCAVWLTSAEARAQKTDVITLDNGDTITCEIKELERGRLRCNTDAMGYVYIQWEHIAAIDTDKTLEVELASGQRYFGSIRAGDAADQMSVTAGAASTSIRNEQVAFVRQLNPTFWSRLDGNVDFGASFTQADNQFDYSLNASSAYKGRNNRVDVTLSSLIKRRDDADTTNRQSLGGTWRRNLRWPRWFGVALANFERNDELDLDLRAAGGYGIGRYLAQTNRWTWSAYAAGVYTHERFAVEENGTDNLELGLATDVQVFTFGDRDTDISTSFIFLPSLTTGGRFRLSLNTTIKREVFKDLYFSVDLFETYDSEPPQADAKKNDLGVTMSFGWKY